MRKVEIESWTLRLIEAVNRGEVVEDAHVELKRDWPEPADAARRIAAHANAAGGSEILWVIGLDEKRGVVPSSPTDLSEYWPRVERCFDELAPTVIDVVVPAPGGGSVTALCITTDRAPFVVKNPDGQGKIQREVPWRSGTSVRTARRSDLIRILAPLQAVPRLEVVDARLNAHLAHRVVDGRQERGPEIDWSLSVELYVTADWQSHVVFPFRLATFNVTPEGTAHPWPNSRVVELAATAGSAKAHPHLKKTIEDGVRQLIVEGSGHAWLHGRGRLPAIGGNPLPVAQIDSLDIAIRLHGVGLPVPAFAQARLKAIAIEARQPPNLQTWTFSR